MKFSTFSKNSYYVADSFDSFLIANLYQQSPFLLICNNATQVNRISDEIKIFKPQIRCIKFPDLELLAYERNNAQKDLIAQRLEALWQIYQQNVDMVVIQATTLAQLIVPIDYLIGRVVIFRVGDKILLNKFKSQLINSGYNLTSQVYEPGEFAVYGSIIDIMPMGSRDLIKIDLFDDEIESLTRLDPKTKTSIEKITEFKLIPAFEYPTDPDSLNIFANNLINQFPKLVDKKQVDEIKRGILPAGCEFYLPLFFNQPSSFFDYINPNWQIVYFDEIFHHLNVNYMEIQNRYNLFNYQYPCLPPEQLFIDAQELSNQIKCFNPIILKNHQTSGDFTHLPNVTIDDRSKTPLNNLIEFSNYFKGNIVIASYSLGQQELIKSTLKANNLDPLEIDALEQIDQSKHQLYLINATIYNGFISHKLAIITPNLLYLHKSSISKKSTTSNDKTPFFDLSEINPGDYLVHQNFGIGKYITLVNHTIDGVSYDMLELEYANKTKLSVPTHNLHLITRYKLSGNNIVELSDLGSNKWKRLKEKTFKKVEDIAVQLLEIYAKRELSQAHPFTIPNEYSDFVQAFGYEPTLDQENAFNQVISDLTSNKKMDRLICGDVGFGKTEVAIRAAFISAFNGYQVAILCPTTLLTEQHYNSFINRFVGFPIKIAEISRFKSKKEIEEILQLTQNGQIDILIGTHRLIQDDVKFKQLGLIIIDEEHRFGVKQKEKLKKFRADTNILTLSATPIPRTLSMSLEGIRDFSLITTPPKKRLSVNTIICNDDYSIIKEGILREIKRGGQIFFVYNDVATIDTMYKKLMELVPELNIIIAHGQMPSMTLEAAIYDFIHQRYNLLLCSTIIENGIDIPNANTIIIYRADKFGLSQLHQLRGRVGRSYHQAYCYLMVPETTNRDAILRIDAITTFNELGAGFNLAVQDLEIRGSGELLGQAQSGEIKQVGISLYNEMLGKAVRKLKRNLNLLEDDLSDNMNCEVNLSETAILTPTYCESVQKRLIFYKRLSSATTIDEVDLVYADIINSCGLANPELTNLIQSHYIRVKALHLGITKVDITLEKITLQFIPNSPISSDKLITLLQKHNKSRFEEAKHRLSYFSEVKSIKEQLDNTFKLLDELES